MSPSAAADPDGDHDAPWQYDQRPGRGRRLHYRETVHNCTVPRVTEYAAS